jgi:MFS transporter, DHA3 family, macrolide efflux protein
MKNNRAILLLLLANSISGIAQGISMLAIPWFFTTIIHSEERFSSIYLVVTSISLVWGIYAGTLVDRYSRKHLFLAINIVGMLVLGAASITGYYTGELHWIWVASVFACTVFIYNIHFPALYALAQEITPKERYGKITSQLEVQGQLTWTIAGGVAAMLLSGVDSDIPIWGSVISIHFRPWHIYEIFTIDALTYIVALVMIWYIRTEPIIDRAVDTDDLIQRVRTGFDYLLRHPILFVFGNASMLLFLTILIHSTLVNPIYVNKFLHLGGETYAASDMVFSMGALVAGFMTTRLFGERYRISGIVGTSVFAGLMYLVHLFHDILPWYFVSYFMIGFCNSACRVLRVTYLFTHIPNNVIGRTNSIFFVMNVFMRMLLTGLFALPLFHQGSNIVWANAVLAAICIVGGVIVWMIRGNLVHQPVLDMSKSSD